MVDFVCLVLPRKGDDTDAGASWGYVFRRDGIAMFTANPLEADTADDQCAESLKIGHDKAMGGAGFRGNLIPARSAKNLAPNPLEVS